MLERLTRARAQPQTKKTSCILEYHTRAKTSMLEHGCDKYGKSIFRSNLVGEYPRTYLKDLDAVFSTSSATFTTLIPVKNLGDIGGEDLRF